MTPTPPSTNSSSTGPVSPDAQQNRVVRKRNRIPLSCGPCRHRKLKCNRAHPCDNCTKRGDISSCTYAQPGNRKKNQANGAQSTPDEMQNRIDRLENLVLSLMTNGSNSVGPSAAVAAVAGNEGGAPSTTDRSPEMNDNMNVEGNDEEDSDIEQVSRSIGVIKIAGDRQYFASEAHWWAILSDIAEVKSYFAEHKKQHEEQLHRILEAKEKAGVPTIGTSLLFKGLPQVDTSEILASFPSRPLADKLVSRYLNSENPAVRILHGPTFRKEYERYWRDPNSMSILWVGMCFAMMCMALQSYHRAGDEPLEYSGRTWDQSLEFLELTSQCLVQADFTQPKTYLMETLCFYLQAEHARSKEAETGLWIMNGVITRMALRMGLHRDGKPYASLTPFLIEMRRRLWCVIRSMDILLSFGCGLPSMVRATDTNTALPTNLYDEEFDEDSKVLPPQRSFSTVTPVSFMIAHGRFAHILGVIMEHTQSPSPLSYESVMKLDNDLREARSEVPEHLQMQGKTDSLLDPASIIMQRYTLDLMYQKCQLILHRRFLSRDNPRYAYSRQACIDACMELLQHQFTMHQETQPSGRLRSVTWSVNSSLTTHDFLLAAMIVCLDLYFTAQAEKDGRVGGEIYKWAVERRDEMLNAIERAIAIWESFRDTSTEAYKASAVLTVMLQKLKHHQVLRQQISNNFSFVQSNNGTSPDIQVPAEHSAAMTLGMMSSGMTPEAMNMYERGGFPSTGLTPGPSGDNSSTSGTSGQMDVQTPFTNFLGMSNPALLPDFDTSGSSFDWNSWDQYVQGSGMDSINQAAFIDSALLDASADMSPPQQDNNKMQQQQQQQRSPSNGGSNNNNGNNSGNNNNDGWTGNLFMSMSTN